MAWRPNAGRSEWNDESRAEKTCFLEGLEGFGILPLHGCWLGTRSAVAIS